MSPTFKLPSLLATLPGTTLDLNQWRVSNNSDSEFSMALSFGDTPQNFLDHDTALVSSLGPDMGCST